MAVLVSPPRDGLSKLGDLWNLLMKKARDNF